MTEFRTKTGRVLTGADVQALADEAEEGYDPADFEPVSEKEAERIRAHALEREEPDGN